MPQTQTTRNSGAIFLVIAVLLVLGVIFYIFPPWNVAGDGADKLAHAQTAFLPVALMWIGSLILAAALIYGLMRMRSRTRGEKQAGEDVTRERYEEERT